MGPESDVPHNSWNSAHPSFLKRFFQEVVGASNRMRARERFRQKEGDLKVVSTTFLLVCF